MASQIINTHDKSLSDITAVQYPSSDISVAEAGSATEKNTLPDEVDWDSDTDPQNPMNWSSSLKWRNLGIISVMSLTTPLASSMFAPSVHLLPPSFHLTPTTTTLTISLFVLGFALGPLLVAPLSEIHGRRPTYLISLFLFLIFTIACAISTNLPMLIVFRLLAGCAGSTPITLGGATIGDTFPPDKRGAGMAIWGMGPLLGPVLGPIVGGYLAAAKGWRWIFWLQAIVSGALLLVGFVFLEETYAVVILERKAASMRKEKGNQALRSRLHDGFSVKERIMAAVVRPTKMLFTQPIVFILSVYVAFLFGYLYLFVTTFPRVFAEQYGFSTGHTGLTYLGLGLGMFIGIAIAGKGSDVLYKMLVKKNAGDVKPEYRLPLLVVSAPLVAVAFFWYGWSAQGKTHWILPILGTVVFGMGMMPGFISVNMYLVHTYGRYSASAIAANKVLQSVGGAFLPLAAEPMYDALGLGWGNSVLAFVALAFVPVPWMLFRYGKKLRGLSKIEI